MRWSPLLIGLTVVGFDTSAAELVVSVDAALRNAPAIFLGGIGRPYGLALLAGLVLFPVLAARDRGHVASEPSTAVPGLLPASLTVVVGLAALVVGARLLVDGSVSLARSAGISEAFVGVSIVAVGTPLPELATSLVAAYRGRPAIALGNVVGSNVFNVLAILGVTAAIAPVPVASRFALIDLPMMIAASITLTALAWKKPVIGRGAGLAMLAPYPAYLCLSFG